MPHRLGYYEDEVKSMLKERKLLWRDFKKWMRGQTCATTGDKTVYYKWDVERFIESEAYKRI